MKRKYLRYLFMGLLIIGVISIVGISHYNNAKEKERVHHQAEVKKHYNSKMKATEETILYRNQDDEWKPVGFLYKDAVVTLTAIKEDYYQVEGTDYHVYYEDLESTEIETTQKNYPNILWDIDIKTNIPTILMEDGIKKYSLDMSITAPVLKKDKDFYTILLKDKIYQISKENIQEEINSQRDKKYANKVSVFYFQEDTTLEKRVKYLKDNNYTFIKETELVDFLEQKIRLPEKSVMIVQKEENELTKKILTEYKIELQQVSNLTQKYQDKDSQVSFQNPNSWYQITSKTTEKRFQDMLIGKKEIADKAEQIPVLNYHFFYDQEKESCNESICIEKKNFMAQLEYLKQNNFKTLTMQEFNDWLDKKIELPKKSVLITVDDGAMGTDTHLPELLSKYDAKATLFLISGWWPLTKYPIGNLEIQSHGHELHHNNFCINGKCGMRGLLLSKEELDSDLKMSIQTIGTPIAFCYPFYAYNDTLTEAVKNNFSLAFVGGNKKASRTSDKYKIPRYIIYKNTSLESFKKMINS